MTEPAKYRPTGWSFWLGFLFGGIYAGWCVKQMLAGVSAHFSARETVVAS